MKLKILAAVVAGAFVLPMAVQAGTVADTMSIDGDIGVAYQTDPETIGQIGSEINIDGKAKVDGITYFGHMELEVSGDGTSGGFDSDELYVGAKFGESEDGKMYQEMRLGDTDNACDMFDPGAEDIWIGAQSISCRGADDQNITYKGNFGVAEFGVSHNPNKEQSAVGARFGMGPVKFNLAYEDGDTLVAGEDSVISYGIAGSFNGVNLNAEGNDNDEWGLNASYVMNNQVFWVSYGDNGSDDNVGGGYRYSHGKMDYIIEHDGATDNTALGLRYRF